MSTTPQRAEARRKRRERVAAQPKPGQWFPVDPVGGTHECNTCGEVKPLLEFGKTEGQWRSERCKACAKKLADRRRSERKLAESEWTAQKSGRVRELWFCAACHAQGIISPVPKGRCCPWHVAEFLERRAT